LYQAPKIEEASMTTLPLETKYVAQTRIACDGDEGALGHPRVFLQMDATGSKDCSYCDRRFILEGGPSDMRAPKGKG
jgi:uncharacterized Zn-finger protein